MQTHAQGEAPLRLTLLPPSPERPGQNAAPLLVAAPVRAHERISDEYLRLVLEAPEMARRARPGQFAMLTVARADEISPVLPRPMALYDWDAEAGTVEFVYKLVGDGTRRLATWQPGELMTVVGPLGRGFSVPSSGDLLLLGRGIGICSVTSLALAAARAGATVHAVSSGRTPAALVGADLYRRAGAATRNEVTDSDGSSAADALRERLAPLFAERRIGRVAVCGSNRLLRLAMELGAPQGASVEVSLEAHMACGLGYCHGCSTGHPGLASESPLVCKDGPVFACIRGGAA
jgi:dihydroorotate dehydrogenase electron transfer subunit